MSFADTGLAQFVASPAGRVIRVVVGIALIAWGFGAGTTMGWVFVVVGLVPLSAGVLDFCYLSALLGGPVRGADIRSRPTV